MEKESLNIIRYIILGGIGLLIILHFMNIEVDYRKVGSFLAVFLAIIVGLWIGSRGKKE